MRKVLVASIVTLMLVAGQVAASDGISAIAPQFAHADYNSTDRAGSAHGGKDHLTRANWLELLLLVGGITAIAVVATSHHDKGRSA